MGKIEKTFRLVSDFFHDYYMGIVWGAFCVAGFGILSKIIDAFNLEPYLKNASQDAHTILNAIHNAINIYWDATAPINILVFIGTLVIVWIQTPKARTYRRRRR